MTEEMREAPGFFAQQRAAEAMHARMHEEIDAAFERESERMRAGDQPRYEISIECDCGRSWSYRP